MKILVTGAAGQLGADCVKVLLRLGHDCRGVDRDTFDLTDADAVKRYVTAWRPDAIIHCAAWTQVDEAELHPQQCAEVNGMGTMNLVNAAMAVNASLMYVSTDHVFSGAGDKPFSVEDKPLPRNIYGLTKVQGEEAVACMMTKYYIVRTSWLFGANGRNFVKSILRLSSEKTALRVSSDQYGSPTYSLDLARMMADILVSGRYGIYHVTNEGFCSRSEFAEEIVRRANRRCVIRPVTGGDHAGARRPRNSRLDKSSLDANGFQRLPSWQDALSRCMLELNDAGIL